VKVVFFDTWTVGLQHFVPLARSLGRLGHSTMLLHRGSFGAELGRPHEEIIKGVTVRDVSYYGNRSLHSILQLERPDAVIMLTSFYLIDRSVILSCRALNIRTFFLMPGIREVDEAYITTSEYETKFKKLNKLSAIALKLPKYLRHIIPNYLYSGFKYSKLFLISLEPWRAMLQLFFRPGRKMLYPSPTHEIHCDIALVYAERYRQFFHEKYGYPHHKLRVVGNPALDGLFDGDSNDPKKIIALKARHGIDEGVPIVTYLATPFVEVGYEGWNSEVRIKELEILRKCCMKSQFQLVIKLHPAITDPDIFGYGENHSSVTVIADTDLPLLIKNSAAVIGHHSSTLLIPIALEKPLFIPRWGLMKNLNDRFSTHGVARALDTPEMLVEALNAVAKDEFVFSNSELRGAYVENYLEPLDGMAVQRIVSLITT
jgi:hypothetical protein